MGAALSFCPGLQANERGEARSHSPDLQLEWSDLVMCAACQFCGPVGTDVTSELPKRYVSATHFNTSPLFSGVATEPSPYVATVRLNFFATVATLRLKIFATILRALKHTTL